MLMNIMNILIEGQIHQSGNVQKIDFLYKSFHSAARHYESCRRQYTLEVFTNARS